MMSQREFGKEVGVVQNYICQLENGRKLTKKIAKRIIDRFGIYEEWLFTGKGEMDIKDEANIIDRLKRENAQLQRENDILNKALMLLEKQGK